MVWAKFDDDWDDEPAIISLTNAAFRAYVHGMLYGARFLTEGIVPAAALSAPHRKAAPELVKAGLWVIADTGWYAPRWHEHYPSCAEREEIREANRQRKRRQRGQG